MSIASLVVPSIEETIDLFSFNKQLYKEDLPTFGLPINDKEMPSYGSSSFSFSKQAITLSKISPIPIPWTPLVGIGSPRPKE